MEFASVNLAPVVPPSLNGGGATAATASVLTTEQPMDTITVDKAALIKTITQNREVHRTTFLKAQEVYRERMIGELDLALKNAREGNRIKRAFSLPVPEDHTEDFDTALKMLQWHQGDQIELDHREFQMYVEDKWMWRASFAANTEAYVVG